MNEEEKHQDDDEEEHVERSIHQLRLLDQRRSSLRLIEQGALALHPEESHVHDLSHSRRFIGGRLGGSLVDSIRNLDETPDEKTGLVSGGAIRTPPLIKWIVPALSCAAAYAFYNIFIKKGSASINPILGGVVLQFVAAILGTSLLGGIILSDPNAKPQIHYDRKGLMWSVCAGLAVGTAEMLSFVVSGMGVPATQSIPIIIGGSVMFGSVLGMVFLGETMMLHGWSGVGMLVFGIGLVATDKGDKVQEGGGGDDGEEKKPALLIWIGPALVCASAYAVRYGLICS